MRRLLNRFAAWLFCKTQGKANDPFRALGKLLPDHSVQFAFTADGIDYYCFADVNQIPCERAFALLTEMEQLNMRCTKDHQKLFLRSLESYINGSLVPTEFYKIAQDFQQRLEYVIEPDIMYNVAALYFFDINESPYVVDWEYTSQKSKRFRKMPAQAFFLSRPIMELFGYPPDLGLDFQTYTRIVAAKTVQQVETMITGIGSTSLSDDLRSALELQVARLKAYTQ